MLGLDVGGRFLRGAICDLRGDVRARLDVEIDGSDAQRRPRPDLRSAVAPLTATGLDDALLDSAVVGVPGVVSSARRHIALATSVAGLEGDTFGADLEHRLGLPVWLENDVNLAALGEQWQGVARGVDDFLFLSIGTGMGAVSCFAASCIVGTTARPERSTSPSSVSRRTSTRAQAPCPRSQRSWRPNGAPDGARATVRRARHLRRREGRR